MDHLFVYGTLAPGRPNAHVLADVAGEWHEATVRGRLVEAGWGAASGYPAIVPDAAGEPVTGQVLSSADLAAHWARLDDFEGDGYARAIAFYESLGFRREGLMAGRIRGVDGELEADVPMAWLRTP